MKTVFADTGYWIAILNPADSLHLKARQMTEKLTSATIFTSEMVFSELLNAFASKGYFLKNAAIQLINQSINSRSIKITAQTSELFRQALDLYNQRPDQSWSHTDCASFLIMRQYQITEALAYDKHFEQAGFVALLR
jgi:predicted nucleic acid-binding protein